MTRLVRVLRASVGRCGVRHLGEVAAAKVPQEERERVPILGTIPPFAKIANSSTAPKVGTPTSWLTHHGIIQLNGH